MTNEQSTPDPGQRLGKTMAPLLVRPAGRRWVVSDGKVPLATAQSYGRYDLAIDADGRQLTFRMPKRSTWRPPKNFEVIDGGTGQKVLDGKIISGGRDWRGRLGERWAVTLASGGTISWIYQRDPRRLGFYDPSGAPVLLISHNPSFTPPAQGGTFRILLRFWAAALASDYRYLAQMETGAIGRLVPAEDVSILALLAMWLERTADGRYPSSAEGAGT